MESLSSQRSTNVLDGFCLGAGYSSGGAAALGNVDLGLAQRDMVEVLVLPIADNMVVLRHVSIRGRRRLALVQVRKVEPRRPCYYSPLPSISIQLVGSG